MEGERESGADFDEKHYTLVFCRKNTGTGREVLLGLKKRGFGAGKWNGFGGKVEKGETFEQGATRELYEESSLRCSDLVNMGYLVFRIEESRIFMKVHVFETWNFEGEPTESDEMRPAWYDESNIPYSMMWQDDEHWLPYLLSGTKFIGRFDFEDEDTLTDYNVKPQF